MQKEIAVDYSVRPQIETYWDFRVYLKDLIEHLRTTGGFSLRIFRLKSGFKSNTHISMILDGRRNLTPDGLRKLAKGLKLTESEIQYLELLVDLNQAKSPARRDQAYIRVIRHKRFLKVRKTAEDEYEFYAHWYRPILLEALGARSFGAKSPAEMAQLLGIEADEVKESLKSMVKLGFIEQTDKGYRRTTPIFQSASIAQSIHVRNLHREMIRKALNSVDSVPKDQRELNSLSISLTEKQFSDVKRKLFEFVQDMASLYGEEASPDHVYQLNLQFFPVVSLKDRTDS
jgi:uncharacterized protein (TIGR02147 family)